MSEVRNERAQPCRFVEVFVDYSQVGKATEFPIQIDRTSAASLHTGDRFVVTGDSVPSYVAEVIELLGDGWSMIGLVRSFTAADQTNDSELARTS
jgi:hypothetical protein